MRIDTTSKFDIGVDSALRIQELLSYYGKDDYDLNPTALRNDRRVPRRR